MNKLVHNGSKRIKKMKYSTNLVLKVNEIFHDIEGSKYHNKHPEILEDEQKRWGKIGKTLFGKLTRKITVLDLGSGTGFVPLQIAKFFKKKDLFICSDLSQTILDACEINVSEKKFKCNFEYLKLNGTKIDLKAESTDYVMMNAVVHHIPNFNVFFREIDRVLKVGGKLIIGHEPNKPFYNHRVLWNNFRFIYSLFYPVQTVAAILRKIGLYEFARRCYGLLSSGLKEEKKLYDQVNKKLVEKGIIENPLSVKQLIEIIDIQSPTAGGHHKERGVDVNELISKYLHNYTIDHLETYNHLCDVRKKNKFINWYSSFLKQKYPTKGATLFVIMKKIK